MRKILKLLPLILVLSAFSRAQPPAERLYMVPDINGMAVTLVKPAFPETAVAANADGEVVIVHVVVDENGTVVSAKCSTACHAMLRDAAESAAIQSKFKPLVREGRAIRYEGTLQYTFVVSRVDWFRFGTALESTRQFDNISLGPVAQFLPGDYAKERSSLIALDANGGADYDTRQKVLTEVTSAIRSRLKGTDLWRYELGLALRRVTFWTQAGESTDRTELQKAFQNLTNVAVSAPEGVSADLVKELSTMSKYRVPADLPERDLRKAIVDMQRKLGPYLK